MQTTITTDGLTAVSSTGWTAAAAARLNAGDIFTIANVYKVNPQSKLSTGQLQQFVVTANFSSDGSGNGSISIQPAIQLTGPNQNVNSYPVSGAAITPLSAANKVSQINSVFHRDAFGLICADLPKPPNVECTRVRSPRLNIAMRMVRGYNVTQDTELYRLDVLMGWAILRPTLACRVQG